MYATKKRKKNMKQSKNARTGQEVAKSNPSKRHRERLNSELDHLASLLPYEQGIISKLDKLSVLRLAVNYLRTKSYFQVAIYDKATKSHPLYHEQTAMIIHASGYGSRPMPSQEILPTGKNVMEVTTTTSGSRPDTTCIVRAEDILQALNGFLLVVTCEGEVFFASDTVEQYLGFHQSDIIHQSVMELIHSEDREQFKLQLFVRPSLNLAEVTADHVTDTFLAFNQQFRRFTVRFRCLLDNTSGFITLEITGRLRVLHGQNLKSPSSRTLALFALCSPLGVLPSSEPHSQEMTFKTRHKMDMSPISMDPRGKAIFGYTEKELSEKKGYDLIHFDDSDYYAAAHQELIKTGSSGLIAYRLLSKSFQWVWLQTSSKVVYKNSKPDCINCVHRQLTPDEGNDLLGKRGSEFKLPYALIYDLGCKSAGVVSDSSSGVATAGQAAPPSLRARHRDAAADDSGATGKEPDSAKGDALITTSKTRGVAKTSVNPDGARSTGKSSDAVVQIQCSSTCGEAHSLNGQISRGGSRPKSCRSQKKVREHLKEYLQAGRRRKAPYREVPKSYGQQEERAKSGSKSDSRSDSRREIDQVVGESLTGNFYEVACGPPHREQRDGGDAYPLGRGSTHYEELPYYGQSHYYNYYQHYHQHPDQQQQHHQQHCYDPAGAPVPGLREFADYQGALYDYPTTIADTFQDHSRNPDQYPGDAPLLGSAYSGDPSYEGQLLGSFPSSNGQRLRLDSEQAQIRHWRPRSFDLAPHFAQSSSGPEERYFLYQPPDAFLLHGSLDQAHRSYSVVSDPHFRTHGQAEDLSRHSRQSTFPHSSFFFPSSGRTSPEADLVDGRRNDLPFESRPASILHGGRSAGFDGDSSSRHDGFGGSGHGFEGVGAYLTQPRAALVESSRAHLLGSSDFEQRNSVRECADMIAAPSGDQNKYHRYDLASRQLVQTEANHCTFPSPSSPLETLSARRSSNHPSAEKGSFDSLPRRPFYSGRLERDSEAEGRTSLDRHVDFSDIASQFVPGKSAYAGAGILSSPESGSCKQRGGGGGGGSPSCDGYGRLADSESASRGNHRSVIRLNSRCSRQQRQQPLQVQAVPVIRASSLGSLAL